MTLPISAMISCGMRKGLIAEIRPRWYEVKDGELVFVHEDQYVKYGYHRDVSVGCDAPEAIIDLPDCPTCGGTGECPAGHLGPAFGDIRWIPGVRCPDCWGYGRVIEHPHHPMCKCMPIPPDPFGGPWKKSDEVKP